MSRTKPFHCEPSQQSDMSAKAALRAAWIVFAVLVCVLLFGTAMAADWYSCDDQMCVIHRDHFEQLLKYVLRLQQEAKGNCA